MNGTKEKSSMIIGVIEAIVAALMILLVTKIVPVCTGMLEVVSGKQVHMKCHYTGIVIVFLGILLLINAVVCMAAKQKLVNGIMTVALAAFVFVAINDTLGIGICANTAMACQTMAPYAKICAVVECVLGIIAIVLEIRERKNQNR